MEHVDYLVIGAGVTGLGFANAIRAEASARGVTPPTIAILEAESEPGGYCRTVVRDGFVWDYSGHFFHFRHPNIEQWLLARMPNDDVRRVVRRSFVRYAGKDIDVPFQYNIHQLPPEEFAACLGDLRTVVAQADSAGATSFLDMLYRRLGAGIVDKFLRPYNEKLYAANLNDLDAGAMGRFFPQATASQILAHLASPSLDKGYNATFTYPAGGAVCYIAALLHDLPEDAITLNERVVAIDVPGQVATTTRRTIGYRQLVSSAPLPALLAMTGRTHDSGVFAWNKVLVFNLGFDRKGQTDVHWTYFPDPKRRFYRVGWYDNILDGERMSLYVEIGARWNEPLDVAAEQTRVLADLVAEGIVRDHRLVAAHHVVLDPAYVHITGASMVAADRSRAELAAAGVHSVGRYGRWTYCSIEDNLIEARELARTLADFRTR